MNEQRFIDLETKLSHQEFLLEELHEVLYAQQKLIDTLEKKVSMLTKRFDDAGTTGNELGVANEKPPHY